MFKRNAREFIFDIKEAGLHVFAALGGLVIFIIFAVISKKLVDDPDAYTNMILMICQLLLPGLGGYTAVMFMQGLLDTEGGEICFTFPRKNIYWGIVRQLRLFCGYAIITALCGLVIAGLAGISYLSLFVLILFQGLAVMSISFLGISVSRRTGIGLVFLFGFIGIQVTLGQEYDFFNFIYVLSGTFTDNSEYNNALYSALIIGIFGYAIGQTWIKPKK